MLKLKFELKMDTLCSIIIRTKDEEEWISRCLEKVFSQTYKNIEVIIVDNNSTDSTLARCSKFPVKILKIKEYLPGKSINLGIKNSKGELIIILSAHCIPTDNYWLENLIKPLKDLSIAGSYGRQEPTKYSSDIDKRDLLLVFGLDSYIQSKDSFFHNANSAFRREVWKKITFCEKATNIEDRLWGEEVIKNGYKIAYVAEASVTHWHGIHHELNPERAKNIVRLLDKIPRLKSNELANKNILNTYCILPIRGSDMIVENKRLINLTINCIKKSNFISKIIISTDNKKQLNVENEFNVDVIIRPNDLSKKESSLEDVLQHALLEIESKGDYCDYLAVAEIIYPFRDLNVVDEIISMMEDETIDTIFAGWKESRATLFGEDINLAMLGGTSWALPSSQRHGDIVTSLIGYFTVTKPKNVRKKSIFKGNIKTHCIDERNNSIVCRSQKELLNLENLINNSVKHDSLK